MNTIIHWLAGIGLALTAAASTTGCQPDPTDDSVLLLGDSISVQALYWAGGGDSEPADLDTHVGLGWRLGYAGADETAPNDYLVEQVWEHERPETLVLALGTNDAGHGDWWTGADLNRFRDAVATPHEDSCLVMVLPAGTPDHDRYRAELDEAARDLRTLAAERTGPTVVVDWPAMVEQDPTLLDTDGIHLADTRAAEVRNDAIWSAVEDCQGML